MKQSAKWGIRIASAALAACCMVGGVSAWLTAKADPVVNTINIGKVCVKLDEGTYCPKDNTTDETKRTQTNCYENVLPCVAYPKTPKITVCKESVASYVFIYVKNGLDGCEAKTGEEGYKTIDEQIKANGWIPLTGKAGYYYKEVADTDTVQTFNVFGKFQINKDCKELTANTKIEVTAAAIQKTGTGTALEAFAKLSDF